MPISDNPYRPPTQSCDPQPLVSDSPHPCPKCGSKIASKVRYNWWGGALGPRLFHVVKCGQCRAQFNGETGKGLGKVILVYNLIAATIAGVGLYLWWTSRN
jgi:hypothetical protein